MGDRALRPSGDRGGDAAATLAGAPLPTTVLRPCSPTRMPLSPPSPPSPSPLLALARMGGPPWEDVAGEVDHADVEAAAAGVPRPSRRFDDCLAETIIGSLPGAPLVSSPAPFPPSSSAARAARPRCTTFPTMPSRQPWSWPPRSWGPGVVLGGGRTSGVGAGRGLLAARFIGSGGFATSTAPLAIRPSRGSLGAPNFRAFCPSRALSAAPPVAEPSQPPAADALGETLPSLLGSPSDGWANAGPLGRLHRG